MTQDISLYLSGPEQNISLFFISLNNYCVEQIIPYQVVNTNVGSYQLEDNKADGFYDQMAILLGLYPDLNFNIIPN